jgi:hypothetical protein
VLIGLARQAEPSTNGLLEQRDEPNRIRGPDEDPRRVSDGVDMAEEAG